MARMTDDEIRAWLAEQERIMTVEEDAGRGGYPGGTDDVWVHAVIVAATLRKVMGEG